MPDPTRTSRKRFQFTLRTLLLVVTATGVFCATAKSLGPSGGYILGVMMLPVAMLGVLAYVTSGKAVPGMYATGVLAAALAIVWVITSLLISRNPLLAVLAIVFMGSLGGLLGGSVHAICLGHIGIGRTILMFFWIYFLLIVLLWLLGSAIQWTLAPRPLF